VPKLILHGLFKGGFSHLKDVASVPAAQNITDIRAKPGVSGRIAWLAA
jgi:hypothetical protein